MPEIIANLVAQFPVLSTIFMVIGMLRTINKPLFSLLHTYVDLTPSLKDNDLLAKIEASAIYKAILYVLDWFGSLKLEVPKK